MRINESELKESLQAAVQKVQVGGEYYHYKHPEQTYTVLNMAITEMDDSVCVIYQANYGEKIIFVRSLASWLESVDVGRQQLLRFTKV